MHRSGTSCLTGTLQAHGLPLGQHSTWNPHNRLGNRENDAVVALHDAVLQDNGGSWRQPPGEIRWHTPRLKRAADILRANAQLGTWGFKDPRSLLLVQGWQSLLGQRLRFVGIFRHPSAVIESLHDRGGFPRDLGLALWLEYNRRLLALHRTAPFPLLCFDWPGDLFAERAAQTAAALGLEAQCSGSFYRSELHTHRPCNTPALPRQCEGLYDALHAAAGDPGAQPTGDTIRQYNR